uniref:Uncharacterized protein n=1 Tax=Mycena chlorophos TaxID=658473 RepID=A0ABQ0M418_MYCCL|nr:predicted protein [Mycena chlorophos]
MSSSTVMANFAPALNDLIQAMYQEPNVFVAISEVDIVMDRWQLRVVQVGGREKGKWWKGGWDGAYVQELLRSSSDTLVRGLAESIAKHISEGEMFVFNEGERLIIGPLATAPLKPRHIDLEQMSAADASEYAADKFLNIALQAQTRQSRLNSSAAPSSVPSSSKSRSAKAIPAPADTEIPDAAPADRKPQQKEKEKEEKVVPKKRKASEDAPARGSVAVRRAGASVINPQRQARKVQAIEFESDDD